MSQNILHKLTKTIEQKYGKKNKISSRHIGKHSQ